MYILGAFQQYTGSQVQLKASDPLYSALTHYIQALGYLGLYPCPRSGVGVRAMTPALSLGNSMSEPVTMSPGFRVLVGGRILWSSDNMNHLTAYYITLHYAG